jgi:hypothetical protein
MNDTIKYIYTILFLISIILFTIKVKILYKYKGWFYKSILLILSGIFITISLYYNNVYVNEYILPILLYLNILILIYITIRNKKNNLDYITIIGLFYLLLTFKLKNFKVKNGKLIDPDIKWIYSSIILLILYYILSNNNTITYYSKIGLILLVLYPLLFPIDEYFIHRIYSLCLAVSTNYLIIL